MIIIDSPTLIPNIMLQYWLFRVPRDPNSIETLQSFGKAVDWAKSGKFTQQDIDEAKLSVFSAVDSPVAPSEKGISSAGNLGAWCPGAEFQTVFLVMGLTHMNETQ